MILIDIASWLLILAGSFFILVGARRHAAPPRTLRAHALS
jgi:hypothetical protein